MSILECRLAAEKECDGKPFTVCEVSTWFYVTVAMLMDMPVDYIAREIARLFDLFGTGQDKSERGATLQELLDMPSNGGISIIPKTKDDFIKAEDWKAE